VPEYISQFSGSSAAFTKRSQVTGLNNGARSAASAGGACAAAECPMASTTTIKASRFIIVYLLAVLWFVRCRRRRDID
jgi:hypothetical protein